MYAQLGNTVFEGLKGFGSFSNTLETNYAEHAILNGKSKLQQMGEKLEEISVTIRLHRDFCDPENEISTLNASRVAGEVLSLVYGNGIYAGDYVIVSMSKTVDQTDGSGTIISADLDIRLKEYYSEDLLTRRKNAVIGSAFGLSKNAVPTIVGIAVTKSSGVLAAEQVSAVNAEAVTIDGLVTQAVSAPSKWESLSTRISNSANRMKTSLAKLDTLLNSYEELEDRAGNLSSVIADTEQAADDLISQMPITDIDATQQSSSILQNHVRDFNGASTGITSSTIIRRI